MDAPLVVDIKRSSLDDGPGLRSVVFFKGCPLRCAWCQNPEALRPQAELQRAPAGCLGCGGCVPVCPAQRARPVADAEGEGCRLCGACVAACPAAVRSVAGTAMALEELAGRLLRDRVFWRRSGGGVTFSGGEPTLFPAYVGALAARLRGERAHVLLETCGHFRWEPFAEHLLPRLDAVYFDLKIADGEQHRRWTGRDNAVIHENLRGLVEARRVEVLPRIPLVPGITDSDSNLAALARLIRGLGLPRVALLPYNPLWVPKRLALGLELPYAEASWMSAAALARCRQAIVDAGLALA